MDSLQLKNKIIQRIIEIEDVKLLKSIDILFNTSDKNISKFLAFANEKLSQADEKEDFTDYIKEWVKSM
ncbi:MULTISPECIES: hypothetical protein [Flavobacteriaceae]|uniref:Uncharacterized protein n=2 Tax=Flavobacteriaceae TaxID=49546 RepID=A0A4Y8AQ03_9FLAO|nr:MULTISPECIES: hypothetical protein [Flavobacteriaceae]TEW72885.1 hypothetical protein E2488_11860 [Gramella jeungdoensis]GGK48899.1 hypothetical protein GCM10007963_16420 [Lutibacter litoralis]